MRRGDRKRSNFRTARVDWKRKKGGIEMIDKQRKNTLRYEF